MNAATPTQATDFAHKWIAAWNSHDLDQILEHYADTLDFQSPVIRRLGVNSAGKISHKQALREYFSKALSIYSDLHFELLKVFSGASSWVLYYKSVNHSTAAEYMEVGERGLIERVRAHYFQEFDAHTFIARWLSAWTSANNPNQHHILAEYYTADCFYADPANPDGITGRERLKQYFKKLLGKNPDWQWKALALFGNESTYTLKWEARIPVKNQMIIVQGLDLLVFENGLIARNEVYFDRSEWLNVLSKPG